MMRPSLAQRPLWLVHFLISPMRALCLVLSLLLFVVTLQAQSAVPNDDVRIRFAHLSVDTRGVDILVNEQLSSMQALRFGSVTEWFTVPAGIYTFVPTWSGVTPKRLLTRPLKLKLESDTWITVALVGSRQRQTLDMQPLWEDYNEIPVGEARLSVFHAVQGIGAVDVLVNGDALFQFVNYPGSTLDEEGIPNDGFVTADIVSNTYTLQVVDYTDADEVLLDIGEVDLLPNHYYWVAAVGTVFRPSYVLVTTDLASELDQNPLFASGTVDNAAGHVRIAHFSSGTPALDIFIDEENIVRNLAFAQVGEFIELPPATYRVTLVPTGLTLRDALIPSISVDLASNAWLTVAVIGTLANDSLGVQVLVEDFSDLDVFESRISIFQSIPGIPPVNVRLSNGTVLVRLLGYPGSQGQNDGFEVVHLVPGVYDLQIVNAADSRNVIVDLQGQSFAAGRNYLLAAIRADPPYVLKFTEVETGS